MVNPEFHILVTAKANATKIIVMTNDAMMHDAFAMMRLAVAWLS